MIKLIFIFSVLLSIAYMREKDPSSFILETSFPAVGLFDSESWDFLLIDKKVKAIVEGPYVEIQSIYTYKNSQDNTKTAKFEFPQMENDIFHKVEVRHQDRNTIFFEEPNSPDKEYAKVDPCTNELYSYKEIEAGSLSAHETVEVVFTVIRPLKVQLNQFYELSIFVFHTPRFRTLNMPFFWKMNYSIQVELRSERPFNILANPRHQIQPELSNHTDSLSGIVTHKAFYHMTYADWSWEDFKIYFASSDFHAPQTLMATHPSNPYDHTFMFSLIPDMNYFPDSQWERNFKKNIRPILRNLANPDNLLKLKNITVQSDLDYFPNEYLFVIDQSESMKGPPLEKLKKTLNNFLGTFSKTLSYFSILSFGNSSQLHWKKIDKYNNYKTPENTMEIMKWVETLEADMGEKDLLGALKYVFEEFEWTHLPKNVIILTAEETPKIEEIIKLVQESSHSQKICAMGVDGDGDNIRKIGEAGGCQTEYNSWWSRDFDDRTLNVLNATLMPPGFNLAYEITCMNDQNQTVHQEEGSSDGISKDKAFIKWVTLRGIPNLNSCKAKIFYYSYHRCFSVERKIETFRSQDAQPSDIWHKVADHMQPQTEEPQRKLIVQKEEELAVIPNQIECDLKNSFESQEIVQEELVCSHKSQPEHFLFENYREQFHNLQCINPKTILWSQPLRKELFESVEDEDEDEDESPSLIQEGNEEESSLLRDEDPEKESFSSLKIMYIASAFTLLFVASLFVVS